jgi:hypothetical protein
MDKIAMSVRLIANDSLPRSFSVQKKRFKKSTTKPHELIVKYVDLLVNHTDWFEINLKFIRDKIIVHSFPRMSAYLISRERGVRVYMANVLGGSSEDAKTMIGLKKKYENQDSNLKSIPDNMWEILHHFQNNDFNLNQDDVDKISEIVNRNGADLVEVDYLERKLNDFLERFAEVF